MTGGFARFVDSRGYSAVDLRGYVLAAAGEDATVAACHAETATLPWTCKML